MKLCSRDDGVDREAAVPGLWKQWGGLAAGLALDSHWAAC